MKHLVLGASGFLGSHLVEHLAESGEEVYGYVRRDSNADPALRAGARIVSGDINDTDGLRRAMRGMDAVYNCAAATGEGLSLAEYRRVNVEGLNSVLLAARSAGPRRLVVLSSVEAYGRTGREPADERAPFRPQYDFQRSKVEAEHVIDAYIEQPDVPLAVARPVQAFGPRDRAVSRGIVETFRTNPRTPLIDGGRAPVSLIYARDVARALHLLATEDRALGKAYIFRGFDTTWGAFIGGLLGRLGAPSPSRSVPYRLAWLAALFAEMTAWRRPPALTRFRVDFLGRRHLFDDTRARTELGWSPAYDLGRGLDLTAEWLRERDAVACR